MTLGASLLILCSFSGFGPPPPVEDPASVLWWTLTDSLSPEQLAEEHRNPGKSLARLEKAIQLGLEKQQETHQDQSLYLNGQVTPELVPFFRAFSAFASSWLDVDGPEVTFVRLQEANIAEDECRKILDYANLVHSRERELRESSREISLPLALRLRELYETNSVQYREAEAAIEKKDMALTEQLLGIDIPDFELAFEALNVDPAVQVAPHVLRDMRKDISPSSWAKLQRFLLNTVASGISSGRGAER